MKDIIIKEEVLFKLLEQSFRYGCDSAVESFSNANEPITIEKFTEDMEKKFQEFVKNIIYFNKLGSQHGKRNG